MCDGQSSPVDADALLRREPGESSLGPEEVLGVELRVGRNGRDHSVGRLEEPTPELSQVGFVDHNGGHHVAEPGVLVVRLVDVGDQQPGNLRP